MTPHPTSPASSRLGFSLAELLAVLVIVGILAALAGPRMNLSLNNNRVARALDLISSDLRLARVHAIRRGGTARVTFTSGTMYVVSVSRGATATYDDLKRVYITRDYPGVTVVPSNLVINFDSRGLLSPQSVGATYIVTRQQSRRDSLLITGIGRVYRAN